MKFFHRHDIVYYASSCGRVYDFYSKCSDKQRKKIKDVTEEADLNIVFSERLVLMIAGKAPQVNVKVLYNAVNTYSHNPY